MASCIESPQENRSNCGVAWKHPTARRRQSARLYYGSTAQRCAAHSLLSATAARGRESRGPSSHRGKTRLRYAPDPDPLLPQTPPIVTQAQAQAQARHVGQGTEVLGYGHRHRHGGQCETGACTGGYLTSLDALIIQHPPPSCGGLAQSQDTSQLRVRALARFRRLVTKVTCRCPARVWAAAWSHSSYDRFPRDINGAPVVGSLLEVLWTCPRLDSIRACVDEAWTDEPRLQLWCRAAAGTGNAAWLVGWAAASIVLHRPTLPNCFRPAYRTSTGRGPGIATQPWEAAPPSAPPLQLTMR